MPTPPTYVGLPNLPRDKGSYVLLMELPRPVTVAVGCFGTLGFDLGLYAYVGSAHGPGGLAARLGHHLRRARRCHWHVDYLRQQAPVVAVWAGWGRAAGGNLNECRLADRLARQTFLRQPYKGFGSSDCLCFSHLLHWPVPVENEPPLSDLRTNAIARLTAVLRPMIPLRC